MLVTMSLMSTVFVMVLCPHLTCCLSYMYGGIQSSPWGTNKGFYIISLSEWRFQVLLTETCVIKCDFRNLMEVDCYRQMVALVCGKCFAPKKIKIILTKSWLG